MADGVTVPDADDVDVQIATDEVAWGGETVHAQIAKLIASADGSAEPLSKEEDSAHASGHHGIMLLAVRKDTAAALAGTDGDYIPLIVDASGLLHVNVGSMPGALRTTDSVSAAVATDALMNGLSALTPKFKSVAVAAAQTDSSVVAAVTSKKLRVVAMFVQCGGTATDLTIESDDASADTQLFKATLAANGGAVLPFNPVGWFETDAGEALIATTGAGSTVQITLVYVEV